MGKGDYDKLSIYISLKVVNISDVDLVRSAFIWLRGSGFIGIN